MKRDLPKEYSYSVSKCSFPVIKDPRGNLSFIEADNHVPFEIKRVYYLYDVPSGAERGGHAHRRLHQMIISMSGSFDVLIHDGVQEHRVHLNRPFEGLYVGPMTWRELDNFSSGSVCLVLASETFDESDYIRDYPSFVTEKFSKIGPGFRKECVVPPVVSP